MVVLVVCELDEWIAVGFTTPPKIGILFCTIPTRRLWHSLAVSGRVTIASFFTDISVGAIFTDNAAVINCNSQANQRVDQDSALK